MPKYQNICWFIMLTYIEIFIKICWHCLRCHQRRKRDWLCCISWLRSLCVSNFITILVTNSIVLSLKELFNQKWSLKLYHKLKYRNLIWKHFIICILTSHLDPSPGNLIFLLCLKKLLPLNIKLVYANLKVFLIITQLRQIDNWGGTGCCMVR